MKNNSGVPAMHCAGPFIVHRVTAPEIWCSAPEIWCTAPIFLVLNLTSGAPIDPVPNSTSFLE